MIIIGITGRVGTGKSKACAIISRHFNAYIMDLDEIGHELLVRPDIKHRIIALFGVDILDIRHQIDRGKLGEKVFSDSKHVQSLNLIMHPEIEREVRNRLDFIKNKSRAVLDENKEVFEKNKEVLKKNKEEPIVILSGALLLEIGVERFCDKTLVIDADDDTIRRFSGNKARVLSFQRSRETYIKHADYCVINTFDPDFEKSVLHTITTILNA
ncbi:dephospho-CoA kinase [Thermoproteota archaeon]